MITLQNPGEIDLNAITTMGVNVKESDSIGFFGTGLKYAIAVFLREEHPIKLYIGKSEYEFYTEPKTIRGKRFDICCMRGPYDYIELGFTTELGKNWELWQAYREIHSNCLDEKGNVFKVEAIEAKANHTTFVLGDMNTYGVFLHEMNLELINKHHGLEIYQGESNHIYYKGIRAKDLEKPSKYTYNILSECDLTEDRRLCYDFEIHSVIGEAVVKSDNKSMIKDVVTAPESSYESNVRMDYVYSSPGPAFTEVVAKNSNKVNHSFAGFAKKHTPKKPLTDIERLSIFTNQLIELCDKYGLQVDSFNSIIEITGELLEVEAA